MLLEYVMLPHRNIFCGLATCALMAFLPTQLYAESSNEELASMGLEELMSLEVTSAAKKKQNVAEAAAAVFVISQDDIRRSGATNIPEALRMVPGVEVAQSRANLWSITIRGFNSRYANKLLVLIDGRPIYSSSFSFVLWDQHAPPLKDVERIEVIRGPGGAVWGSNAVNGVINIITKHTVDTLGTHITASVGNEADTYFHVRQGTELSNGLTARLYGQFERYDGLIDGQGNPESNGYHATQLGIRFDWHANEQDQISLSADHLNNEFSTKALANTPAGFQSFGGAGTTANVQAKWLRSNNDGSDLQLQISYDYQRRQELTVIAYRRQLDMDFVHRLSLNNGNELVWGLGYKQDADEFVESDFLRFTDNDRKYETYSAFVQNDLFLLDRRLRLSLGSKFEQNDVTGFEIQPSIRAYVDLGQGRSFWVAASKANRTPSRAEEDSQILINLPLEAQPIIGGAPIPVTAVLSGGNDLKGESITSIEAGFRTALGYKTALDLTAYYNDYEDLLARIVPPPELIFGPTGLTIRQDIPLSNNGKGHSHGVEAALSYTPTDWAKLNLAYTYLNMSLSVTDPVIDYGDIRSAERNSPQHQISLRGAFDVLDNVDMDFWLRYVDKLTPETLPPNCHIKDYVDLDIRLAWRINHQLEFVIAGQNLLEKHRQEFQQVLDPSAEPFYVQRSVYARLNIDF